MLRAVELKPVVLYFHLTEARHGKAEDDTFFVESNPLIFEDLKFNFLWNILNNYFSFFLQLYLLLVSVCISTTLLLF